MYGVIINQQGFVVNDCVILDEDNKPQGYELKATEKVVSPFTTNNLGTDFIKRKWNGTTWVEGATQTEIEEYNEKRKPKPQKPSQQEILNAQLLKSNAETKIELDKQKQLNSQLLLEIAKLKGGTANV